MGLSSSGTGGVCPRFAFGVIVQVGSYAILGIETSFLQTQSRSGNLTKLNWKGYWKSRAQTMHGGEKKIAQRCKANQTFGPRLQHCEG